MSTFYVFPLVDNQQDMMDDFIETKTDTHSLLSEIHPLTKLADSVIVNNHLFDQKQQSFWLPTPPLESTPIQNDINNTEDSNNVALHGEFEETVTHSFANRKRSVVKRRKSVLSSCFTAEDEDAIKSIIESSDPEANLDVSGTNQNLAEEVNKESTVEYFEQDPIKTVKPEKKIESDDTKNKNPTSSRGDSNNIRFDSRGVESRSEQVPAMSDGEPTQGERKLPNDSAIDLTRLDPSPVAPAHKKSKKKRSSWSPRKIFQTPKDLASFFFNRKPKDPYHPTESIVVIHAFNPTRLPIQTERAIYRMSHLKLSSSKRSLRDQVLISNMMFWYMSLVHDDDEEMTKRACRIQVKPSKSGGKRLKRKLPNYGLYQLEANSQPNLSLKKPSGRQTKYHILNTSSSDEDSESDDESLPDDLSISSDEDDGFQKPKKEGGFLKKKYSFFNPIKKSKEVSSPSWLPSFSIPKQSDLLKENEDDIPLAMYQRVKN